ncbi:MAG: glycosyl hydrolase [Isosphaeraceae bacterium]
MFGSTSRSSAVALVLLLLGCPSLVTAAGDPGDSFGSPPADTRILKIIHNWPDEAEAQDGLIAQLVRQGFGGVVCNVSFEGYLQSEAKWRAFVRAEEAARKSGMALWLYDERGYPSGNAGGLVLRDHPEWEAEGLLIIDAASDGKRIELAVPPGSLLTAAAFPERDGVIAFEGRTDLAGTIRGGRLEWTPPAGRWHAIVITRHRLYEGTHAEGNLAEKMPYVNLLRPEPTRKFLELTHQQYARRFGADLGRHFVSTFTDEPSLMSWFLKPMPYRVLPWAPALADEFRRRRGYALEPVLPNLVLEAGGPGARNRYDYWLTVGELVSENFFGQIQDWCRGHNIASGGHLLMEESLTSHVPLYGDLFRCARRLDAPSIDCLTSLPPDVPWWIARLLASAAEVEGKSIVMSETSDHAQRYRPPGDARPVRTVTEAEIRGTCHRLIAGGVKCITSYYSFAGLSDDAIRRLNEEVGRRCAMMPGGHQAADIAAGSTRSRASGPDSCRPARRRARP